VCRLNDVANPPKRSVTLHTRTKGTGDGCGIRWTRRFSGRKANTRGRCHHKLSCASTTPKTVCKPQSEPKTPWRARCFSGMRWSGCGTALQHPSNRSCVRFADARQHRGRAWYIEVSASKCVRMMEGTAACQGRPPEPLPSDESRLQSRRDQVGTQPGRRGCPQLLRHPVTSSISPNRRCRHLGADDAVAPVTMKIAQERVAMLQRASASTTEYRAR
jgi:hypothetical protein